MTMTVGQIRTFVRLQLDVDEEEYPNALLDAYIEEAFIRTVSLEPYWPGYEQTWSVTKAENAVTLTPPGDLNMAFVDSIVSTATGRRLVQIAPEMAEEYLLQGPVLTTGISWFTTYGNTISLWPQIEGAEEGYVIRGQRIPTTPDSNDSTTPDCDGRLHRLLCHYVIALMYANQEDEVLEEVYMKRWMASFASVRRSIMASRHSRPLVLNAGLRALYGGWGGGPTTVWDLP